MALLHSEYMLVTTLKKAEKRVVRAHLAARDRESSPLKLYDLLLEQDHHSETALRGHPLVRGWGKGLSTVAARMRSAVSLALMGQVTRRDRTVEADLFEARLYLDRRLPDLARRTLQRGLRTCREQGRYAEAIGMLRLQRRWLQEQEGDPTGGLEALQRELRQVEGWLSVREELAHLRGLLLARSRRELKPRDHSEQEWVGQILRELEVLELRRGPDLLSHSLAVDLRGLALVLEGRGEEALPLFRDLLLEWRDQPDWIARESALYLELFRHYQRSIYFGTTDPEVMGSYRELLPPDHNLSESYRLEFQRINFSHQLTFGLNLGQFDALKELIPQVEAWLQAHRGKVEERVELAFRHNVVVAFFLSGDFGKAYQSLQAILNRKRSTVRMDIQAFARVLEVVLLYELGQHDLNAYVLRRSKRFFGQQGHQVEFERAVLDHVGRALRESPAATLAADEQQLALQLQELIDKTSRPTPLLGLVEIHLWISSRIRGKGIEEVFLERIGKSGT